MAHQRVLDVDDREVAVDATVLQALRRELNGTVVLPEDEEYDEARSLWNGMIDRRPAFFVRCAGEEDVRVAVRFAGEHRLKLSVRGGGHNVGGLALQDGAMVIDLSEMKQISVDPERRLAVSEAGVTIGELDAATQEHGLATPLGVVTATGIAGLTLHGGLGWLARRHGMTVDNVRSFRVVTADGAIQTASRTENPELYWALRGGGGNLGVVTAFEYELHPIGPQVYRLLTFYPIGRAKEALRFYREQLKKTPEELGEKSYWAKGRTPEVMTAVRGRGLGLMPVGHILS